MNSDAVYEVSAASGIKILGIGVGGIGWGVNDNLCRVGMNAIVCFKKSLNNTAGMLRNPAGATTSNQIAACACIFYIITINSKNQRIAMAIRIRSRFGISDAIAEILTRRILKLYPFILETSSRIDRNSFYDISTY